MSAGAQAGAMQQQGPQAMPQQKIPGSSMQQTAEQFQNPMEEQMMPGKEGTGSKFLLGAIQNIQGYIQMSTNPQKIQMLRQLVQVFTNMLAQEQQEAMEYLQGSGQGAGQGSPMMMGEEME